MTNTTRPIRVLEVVNVMDRAGIETMLMNHYRAMDRSRVQLDFLEHRPWEGAYDDEIRSMGGRVFYAPRLYPQNCLAYRRYMRDLFAEHHEWRVVHSHIDAMSAFPLAAARSAGVAVRISHSHSDSLDRDLKALVKGSAAHRLRGIATHFWACSEASGVFLFGEENRSRLHIVKNAIDLGAFSFDPLSRVSARAELGVSGGQLVVGHVGRFSGVKNHAFLVDVLGELVREGCDAILVLVGDGELRDRIGTKAAAMGMVDRVRFLGLRDDVARLMCGFDALCFPSLHEGIPVTLIEAQASGLPVLASDKVSAEALVLPETERLSLDAPPSGWAGAISRLAAEGRSQDPATALAAAGYDIKASAKGLVESYLTLHEGAAR